MSPPSILVLWYQRLVLTTMMSPGLTTASMSPWHAHQHSGGGRSSQRLVPDTWACHELRSTLSMWTWAPGPGVPAIHVTHQTWGIMGTWWPTYEYPRLLWWSRLGMQETWSLVQFQELFCNLQMRLLQSKMSWCLSTWGWHTAHPTYQSRSLGPPILNKMFMQQ